MKKPQDYLVQIEVSLVHEGKPYDVRLALPEKSKHWRVVDVRDQNDFSLFGDPGGKEVARAAGRLLYAEGKRNTFIGLTR